MRRKEWKSEWIRQRKKDQRDPNLRAYKFQCFFGHIRIERTRDGVEGALCPACESNGKSSSFRYVGIYTIARSQAKRAKGSNIK